MALPHGVKLFKVNEPESAFELYSIDKESGEIKYYKYRGKSLEIGDMSRLFRNNDIPRFKPYLRPMSSMTNEELRQYNYLYAERENNNEFDDIKQYSDLIDWLNAHHFDYRGLIPKGLAIEAPDGMYNLKEK